MGIGAWWHWLVVLVIVVLIFGTKKLRNIGGDLGGAVRDFKDAMNEGKAAATDASPLVSPQEPALIASDVKVAPAKSAPKRKASAAKSSATTAAKSKSTTKKTTATKAKASTVKKANVE